MYTFRVIKCSFDIKLSGEIPAKDISRNKQLNRMRAILTIVLPNHALQAVSFGWIPHDNLYKKLLLLLLRKYILFLSI